VIKQDDTWAALDKVLSRSRISQRKREWRREVISFRKRKELNICSRIKRGNLKEKI